ncbi:uncharacterized protein CMU_023410 [Cryptosporidium muris RN66]|uniref:Uncharacterized protein n=1 Tax=Cryptosporidium muris (strain RN66) TaxID=441375 RepID=B6ABY3_CRYMR|nr:uncharacterized protein CMU_023410 [Cryptosporidium muris RN66]EEA05336.1 hypothetical protein CMU_023410 [Cryptosporidium muris RN66]|eukprot:XP_002139685.1 hypothetical protein [Cryptosporidium muris RN66]
MTLIIFIILQLILLRDQINANINRHDIILDYGEMTNGNSKSAELKSLEFLKNPYILEGEEIPVIFSVLDWLEVRSPKKFLRIHHVPIEDMNQNSGEYTIGPISSNVSNEVNISTIDIGNHSQNLDGVGKSQPLEISSPCEEQGSNPTYITPTPTNLKFNSSYTNYSILKCPNKAIKITVDKIRNILPRFPIKWNSHKESQLCYSIDSDSKSCCYKSKKLKNHGTLVT